MNSLTRRTFLKSSVGAAALLGAARAAESTTAAPASGFRIFACDWTLQKTCSPDAFALAAKIGLDGVQVDFGRLKEGVTTPPLFDEAQQDRILAAAVEHRVAIASLAMGVLNAVPYKSHAATEQWVLDSVRVMQRMRARVTLLAFFSNGDLVNDPSGVSEVIRRLKVLAPRAEAAGVVYGLESWLKAPELERILDAVNSPAIRVYYDVGNMQKVGEDIGAAIRRLGRERICEVHLKDYDDLYGKGSINFSGVRTALDAAGYRGWLGIEGVKTPLGVEASIRYDLDYLRPIFPRSL
ncbi:sugar phosphate isomerase/epimerase family protein [Horticoccus sp. 23ND18S-11]|uniref:sugar phosphate isomerase/epimerase family protein n=1 Tax=Horticoccus sp. 23ND18S-11 TaxID=3391832 RepID=UPI0039C8D596